MTQQTFRSALNGFNREDVVRYIEYLNSVHTAEINQLNSELDFLRKKEPAPASVAAPIADTAESDALIEQQATRIRELFDRCKELETQLAEAQEAKVHAEEKLQAVLMQQNTAKTRAAEELEAYRRAERMERQAKERAERLYQQTNGALADASLKVDEAAGQIGQLSDLVMSQLAQLQDAITSSKQALKDAADTMYTIRPGGET